VKALSEFTANAPPSIDANLNPEYILQSWPLLPRPWLTSGRKTVDPEREFHCRGHVQLSHEAFSRDIGYAFYICSAKTTKPPYSSLSMLVVVLLHLIVRSETALVA
jgi:hypothetical protein